MELFPKPGELGLDAVDAGLFGLSIVVAGAVVHLLHAVDVLAGAPGVALGAATLKGRRWIVRHRLSRREKTPLIRIEEKS